MRWPWRRWRRWQRQRHDEAQLKAADEEIRRSTESLRVAEAERRKAAEMARWARAATAANRFDARIAAAYRLPGGQPGGQPAKERPS